MSDLDKLNEVINHLETQENLNLQNYQDKDPEGVGDTLERVFSAFGITEEFIERASKIGGCGCQKAKQFLNRIFPYKKYKSQ